VTAPTRLALFAAVVVLAGILGAGLGAVVGPIDVGGSHDPAPASTPADHGDGHEPAATTEPAAGTDHGGGPGEEGHDIDEPCEVPTIGPSEGGS
jgi:hypothetical protein